MPHIQQRFLVHRLVFENGVHGLGAIEERMARLFDRRGQQRVEYSTVRLGRECPHFSARRPRERCRRPIVLRIDAAREQALEIRVDASLTQRPLDERVEVERGEVAFVEHDRMTERNRPLVIGVRRQEIEQRS